MSARLGIRWRCVASWSASLACALETGTWGGYMGFPPASRERKRLASNNDEAEREDKRAGALDDPNDPEHGDPWRQTAFLAVIMFIGFALNILAIVIVSGGK